VPRLRGITKRVARDAHDLMVFNVESSRERADAFAKFARRDGLDGLIVISLSPTDDEVAGLGAEQLPTVLVGARHAALSGVSIDNAAGGELATAYLLARGHTRIGFVGDAPSPLGFTAGDRRYQGYRRALERAGIRPDPAVIWEGPPRPGETPGTWRGPHSRVDAREAVAHLLGSREPPTAVFAVSDMQAIGALEAARHHGVKVPSELAIIGFDDSELAEIAGLTTVHQPLEESGAEGARILLEALAGDREPVRLTLPLRIVERETA
jgi:DNA-binding LacI/PurR family transcriptional regulator